MADVSAGSLANYPSYTDYAVNKNDYDNQPWMVRTFAPHEREKRLNEYEKDKAIADANYQRDRDLWLAAREDSQVQRVVEDMKKAGLNPWLAVQNGFTANNAPSLSSWKTSSQKVDMKEKGTDTFRNLISSVLKVALIAYLVG